MKIPFPPLTFVGKSFTVVNQVRNERGGIVPDWVKPEEHSTIPVAVLLSHFDRCYVLGLVRIVQDKNRWGLSLRGLDHPDAHPWFLVKASDNLRKFFFIVNEDFEFYPIRAYVGTSEAQNIDEMHLLPPDIRKRNCEWTEFSAVDRAGVEIAIQSYMAQVGLR